MKLIPNWLRRPFEDSLGPVADGLIAARVHPNTLTTLGFLTLTASAVAFASGNVRVAGALLLLSGVMDMLDGKVARGGEQMSRFGAFYDSTLDRIGEAVMFGGIIVFFMKGGVPAGLAVFAVMATTVALAAGLIVSYARARAEGLMLECKVGLAQRAERILGLGVPVTFFGAGRDGLLLLGIVNVLALLATVTVVQRIHHVYKVTRTVTQEKIPDVYKVTRTVTEEKIPGEPVVALVDSLKKGRSGE